MDSLAMEPLDGLCMFPPTPPSSSPSPCPRPCLDVCVPLWPAPLLPDSTTCWEEAAWTAVAQGGGWTLDGLPDVKPDVSELLEATLRPELPVLNAESTNFLEEGAVLATDNSPAPVDLRPDPRAATPAPWLTQWTYCAYCAAGGVSPCQGVVPNPSGPAPGQAYQLPGPGGLYQALPPSYLAAIGAAPGPLPSSVGPFAPTNGLVYVEAAPPPPPDNAFATPVPLEGPTVGGGVRWAPASAPVVLPSPAPETLTQGKPGSVRVSQSHALPIQ